MNETRLALVLPAGDVVVASVGGNQGFVARDCPNFANWRYHSTFAFKVHLIANDYSNSDHSHCSPSITN